MNSLVDLIAKDGLKVAHLEQIYAACRDSRRLVDDAISAMRHMDSDIAWRAVWVLKRCARDRKLSSDDVIRIASCAEELPHWASRLNLCQLLATTGCPEEAQDRLFPYLVECFGNRRPMIRAWAISVLVGFEDRSDFRKTTQDCLQEARTDRAGSIQSRLRQLKKPRPNQALQTTPMTRSVDEKTIEFGHP